MGEEYSSATMGYGHVPELQVTSSAISTPHRVDHYALPPQGNHELNALNTALVEECIPSKETPQRLPPTGRSLNTVNADPHSVNHRLRDEMDHEPIHSSGTHSHFVDRHLSDPSLSL